MALTINRLLGGAMAVALLLGSGGAIVSAGRRNLAASAVIRCVANSWTVERTVASQPSALSMGRLWRGSLTSLTNDSAGGRRLRGVTYLLTGQELDGAVAGLQAAVALSPADRLGHYWLGVAWYRQGNELGAREQWRQARAANALFYIGETLKERGQRVAAQKWYVRAAEIAADEDTRHVRGLASYALAQLYLEEGRRADGLHWLETAVMAWPQNVQARYRLAREYSASERHAEAIAQMQAVLTEEPFSATWRGAMAEALLRAGENELAAVYFHQALQIGNPHNAQDRYWLSRAWYGLSMVAYQRQAWEESLTAAAQAVTLRGAIDRSWYPYFEKLAQEALAANPEEMECYLLIGAIYEAGQEYAGARDYYHQAEQRWPQAAEVRAAIERVSTAEPPGH